MDLYFLPRVYTPLLNIKLLQPSAAPPVYTEFPATRTAYNNPVYPSPPADMEADYNMGLDNASDMQGNVPMAVMSNSDTSPRTESHA